MFPFHLQARKVRLQNFYILADFDILVLAQYMDDGVYCLSIPLTIRLRLPRSPRKFGCTYIL